MHCSLGRILIYTSKIDDMADFYARHFGFSVIRSDTDRLVELRPADGGATILLHPVSDKRKQGQTLVKLVFDVSDVPGFAETARAAGLDFGPIHKADGYVFANAKDPSMNSVQISSRAFV